MGEDTRVRASPTLRGRGNNRPQRAAARLASSAVQKDANRDGLRDEEDDEITPLRGSAPASQKKQVSRKQRKQISVPKRGTEITEYMSARKGDAAPKHVGDISRAASGSNEQGGQRHNCRGLRSLPFHVHHLRRAMWTNELHPFHRRKLPRSLSSQLHA